MPKAKPSGRAYVESTQRLRESIDRNSKDAELVAKDGAEIIYIFDANVFIFHADLTDGTHLTGHLNSLVGNSDPALSQTLDRLTARFLFSTHLPGQTAGECYIAAPHLEEVFDNCARIARNLGKVFDKDTARRLHQSEGLQAKIQAILNSRSSAAHKLAELVNVVPKAWITALDAASHFKSAIAAAFEQQSGGLVPLDRTDWGNAAAKALWSEDVADWRAALPKPSKERSEKALQDDAETLQTIVNLYQQSEPVEGEERTRHFLFITADEQLADAVRSRAEFLEFLGIPVFVRSPQDYLPLLNLNSMTDALSGAEHDEKLRRAFKSVFDTLRSALEWAGTEPTDGIESLEHENPAGALATLREAWAEFSKYVAVLSLRHEDEEVSRIFAELGNFVSSASSAQSAARLAQISVTEVRNRHIDIVIENALRRLRRARRDNSTGHARRVNIFIVGDVFGNLLSGQPDISAFLDAAVRDEALPPDTLALLRSDPSKPEAQLLAACLFVAAERWHTATEFARRAQAALMSAKTPRPAAISEASYLVGLCSRFSMQTRFQFEAARRSLNANISYYLHRRIGMNSAYLLRRNRDEIELGTLLLSAAVNQMISSHLQRSAANQFGKLPYVDDVDVPLIFQSGASLLKEARENFLDDPQQPRLFEGQIERGIRAMTATNLVGSYIFERLVPGLQLGAPVIGDEIHELLTELGDEMESQRMRRLPIRLTQSVYFWAATALASRDRVRREHALDQLASLLAGERPVAGPGPLSDQLEFKWIQNWNDHELTSIRGR